MTDTIAGIRELLVWGETTKELFVGYIFIFKGGFGLFHVHCYINICPLFKDLFYEWRVRDCRLLDWAKVSPATLRLN